MAWKTISSQLALDEKWFTVRRDCVQLPNGTAIPDYFIWVKGDVSLVVPVTGDGSLVLTRQYKHGAGRVVVEFPAGYLDQGETPEEAARRELSEETGYMAQSLRWLANVTNDATKETGRIHILLALDVEPSGHTRFDENEDIQTLLRSPSEVLKMTLRGEISTSASGLAALLALTELGHLTTSEHH